MWCERELGQVNGEREACTLGVPRRSRSVVYASQSALSLTDCAYVRTWLASAGPAGQFSPDALRPRRLLGSSGGLRAVGGRRF